MFLYDLSNKWPIVLSVSPHKRKHFTMHVGVPETDKYVETNVTWRNDGQNFLYSGKKDLRREEGQCMYVKLMKIKHQQINWKYLKS